MEATLGGVGGSGSALDLGIESFQWVGAVDLQPVRFGEHGEGQYVGFALIHQGTDLGVARTQLVSDNAAFSPRFLLGFLVERQ